MFGLFFVDSWAESQNFTVVVQLLYPTPQSESSFLDTCPGVGKFICEKKFLGRVELPGGDKVTEQPR